MVVCMVFMRTTRTIRVLVMVVMVVVELVNQTAMLKHGVRRDCRPEGQQQQRNHESHSLHQGGRWCANGLRASLRGTEARRLIGRLGAIPTSRIREGKCRDSDLKGGNSTGSGG